MNSVLIKVTAAVIHPDHQYWPSKLSNMKFTVVNTDDFTRYELYNDEIGTIFTNKWNLNFSEDSKDVK